MTVRRVDLNDETSKFGKSDSIVPTKSSKSSDLCLWKSKVQVTNQTKFLSSFQSLAEIKKKQNKQKHNKT